MKLKDKLYNLRKKNGYTQAEIAEILEVSRQSVSNWELGTIQPSISRLKKLSELYSTPLEILLDDSIEVQCHPEHTEVQDESIENSECSLTQNKEAHEIGHMKKAAVIVAILLAIGIGVCLFLGVSKISRGSHTELEQFKKDKVSVSSEDGFDFQ